MNKRETADDIVQALAGKESPIAMMGNLLTHDLKHKINKRCRDSMDRRLRGPTMSECNHNGGEVLAAIRAGLHDKCPLCLSARVAELEKLHTIGHEISPFMTAESGEEYCVKLKCQNIEDMQRLHAAFVEFWTRS